MKNNKKDNILYIIFAFLGTLPALFLNVFPILFWGIFLFFLILLCLSLGIFGIFIIIVMIITVIISAVYIFGGKQPPFFIPCFLHTSFLLPVSVPLLLFANIPIHTGYRTSVSHSSYLNCFYIHLKSLTLQEYQLLYQAAVLFLVFFLHFFLLYFRFLYHEILCIVC